MKRRYFLGTLTTGAFLLRHRMGLAQQPSGVRRVGIIDDSPLWVYFRERLRELGDIDGQSITIESRTANGVVSRRVV